MRSIETADLAEIAPYKGAAFKEAVIRLAKSPYLPTITEHFFPNVEIGVLRSLATAQKDADGFAENVMAIAVKSLINRTLDDFKIEGLEQLDSSQKYLFISNHRDIIADSALLSFSLVKAGMKMPNICLGDNLLFDAFASDLLKVNKGIIVKRGLSQRELLRWSQVLSELIFQEISEKRDSVWLAQKEGRCKDGLDRTHPGILKMLGLRARGDLLTHFEQLRLVPVSISYEFDPCDVFKAREQVLKQAKGDYTKAPDEDRMSMATGVGGYKGRVVLRIGSPMTEEIAELKGLEGKKAQIEGLTEALDRAILGGYRLWPGSFVAFDEMEGSQKYTAAYQPPQREVFLKRLESQMALVTDVDSSALRPVLLRYYAGPILSCEEKGLQIAPK